MLGIYAAVTRKTLSGQPESGWFPQEKLTVEEAIRAYTLNTAYAAFEEDIKGSITVGKLADYVVLSDNLLTMDPDDIKDVIHLDVQVPVGTKVTWINRDPFAHTTTAGVPGSLTGEWDSGSLSGGNQFSLTFSQVGSFAYFCTIHPSMTGTVTVVASGSASVGGTSSGGGGSSSGSDYEYP